MSSTDVDRIARAVLYEGYLLYPYRPSAIKNQQRWNFGVLYPPAWAANQTGSDRSYFQMECVAETGDLAQLEVCIRFLQLLARQDGGREWQEGIEQSVCVRPLSFASLCTNPWIEGFSFSGGEEHAGGVLRKQFPLEGLIEISASEVAEGAVRLQLRVSNTTAFVPVERNAALLHSLASAHAALTVRNAEFVSQIDPPEELRAAVAACQNVGVWPVLVGEAASRSTMLGSPIILYDYPQVAPESKGDLFDSTEIDEILTLRILTLTDEEKREMRRSDERARRILDRLESIPPEHLLELHGKIRSMEPLETDRRPSAANVHGIELKKGDRVRLRPRKRADIFDTLLEDKIAVIEAVEEDFERNIHFAVVLEDDPGRDLGEMRQIGHRFFFSPEEVAPLQTADSEHIGP